ncbi:hypothetical protein ACIQOU_12115 [Streptomyces sp. NPDC091279]|uniref:hypothetical protein n=1 Tax=unclassified Streptomyces TaxID=2593676 RepID=UPI003828FF67
MTTLLETRYRTVLRLLPAYYRREREDEMVEVYLWGLDRDTQDQHRPTLGETASVAALAIRSRLAATGAPRRYLLLGATARTFALFAVLLQAAAVLVERVLVLAYATTHGSAAWRMFLAGFTGGGPLDQVAAVAQWVLPLLWTAAFLALAHDRRRLARSCALLAALPTLWPLARPLIGDTLTIEPWSTTASLLFTWLTVLALGAAYHRDAPAAVLPVGTPGLVLATCAVATGAAAVLMGGLSDPASAPATCFVVAAVGRLLTRAHGAERLSAGAAAALAALGLLLLAVRVSALWPWLDLPLPAAYLGGALGQIAALALLVPVFGVIARRDLAAPR